MASLQEDPPCIVGMACRLPGNIRSSSDLWRFIVEQKSAHGPVPPNRYKIDGFYHPQGGERSGSTNVAGGYFINEDVRLFDNSFFGINNLEATYMDPQQRKLLEVVYECLQNSGTTMESISGSMTGVYVANFSVDYQPGQLRDPDYLHRYTSTGSGATIMSNRINHVFNLQGPSLTVDTACSSSVYALHQALNAMRAGDCDKFIVASANLIMSPEMHIGAARSGVLSPTGMSHTFDISADGYGRAEGVNAIYVKRLSAALRDKNPIRAVIRGSATNASGKTAGISLPSGRMQEMVMKKAYQNAGLDPAGTDYIECHGTGTPVGDPIEVDAIGRYFSRQDGPLLLLGSVKTNVGHSEAASGLTSILKVVEAFTHGQIPPTYGIVTLNPKLILQERNLKIATTLEPWPRTLRRASINSFGYGGANGHIIIESTQSYLVQYQFDCASYGMVPDRSLTNGAKLNGTSSEEMQENQTMVIPLSAASSYSLGRLVNQVRKSTSNTRNTQQLCNLVRTLCRDRDYMRYRASLLATYDEVAKHTTTTISQDAANTTIERLPVAFIFTGQGAQYAGMGRELLSQNPKFQDTIRRLDRVLHSLPADFAPDWTIEKVLSDSEDNRINEVTRSQTVCTAVQIGLVDILQSWGVWPTSVVGHSSGEIAAGYAAGLLDIEQAIQVAYFRGYVVDKLTAKGAMVATGLAHELAQQLIERNGLVGQICVACVNSTESVTLSGSPAAVEILEQELKNENVFIRRLETGERAYHSPMMKEIGLLYEEMLERVFQSSIADGLESKTLTSQNINVRMYSSVGLRPENVHILRAHSVEAAYWRKNLEQPVQFSAAVSNLLADEKAIHLVEIGPHSALKGPINQIRKALRRDDMSLPYSATLVKGMDADLRMKTLAGSLHIRGHELAWDAINNVNSVPGQEIVPRLMHELEPYPWDYTGGLLWSEPRASYELRNRQHMRHELLGTMALTGNGIDFTWRNLLRISEVPWIKDHRLEEQVVFPAAAYVAMAVEAVSQITRVKKELKERRCDCGFELRDVKVSTALNIPDENEGIVNNWELHTTMSRRKASSIPSETDWHDFSVSSYYCSSRQAIRHCTGSIRVHRNRSEVKGNGIIVRDSEGFDAMSPMSRWYRKWHQEGLCFGPQFQSLTSLRTDPTQQRLEAIGASDAQPDLPGSLYEYYPIHPLTIDAGIQATCLSSTAGIVTALKTWLPVSFAEFHIWPTENSNHNKEVEIHAKAEEMSVFSRRIDCTIRDTSGVPIVDFSDGRIALYTSKEVIVAAEQHSETNESDSTTTQDSVPLELYSQRQPTLRVQWRPDILRLPLQATAQLREYVAGVIEEQPLDMRDDESFAVIGALLGLAGHKNPRLRVLEIGGDSMGYKADQWLAMLGKKTSFSLCRSWHTGKLSNNRGISISGNFKGPFDVILFPSHVTSRDTRTWSEDITSRLTDHGMIIFRDSDVAMDRLSTSDFHIFPVMKQVVLGVRCQQVVSLQGRQIIILLNEDPSDDVTAFAGSLVAYLTTNTLTSKVAIVRLNQNYDVEIDQSTISISLLEMERELLATMSPQAMDNLRRVTNSVTSLIWLTGANMLGTEPDPNLTLSSGLSRSLMLEQPALRWSVLDVGVVKRQLSNAASVENICESLIKVLVPRYDKDDCEFILNNGILHVSRYRPDFAVNSLFSRRIGGLATKLKKGTLGKAKPARLAIGLPGANDTIHFQALCEAVNYRRPPPDFVDIEVKAIGLNSRDVRAIVGQMETRGRTTGTDLAGIVTAVGPDCKSSKDRKPFQIGDRVVSCAPFHIGTTARVPLRSVHRLSNNEDFTAMPTFLYAYATALYTINDQCRLRRDESVLIHAGPGAFGIPAVVLAQRLGATVYATCDSKEMSQFLVNELGLGSKKVFILPNPAMTEALLNHTGRRGVDVVISSTASGLMVEGWEHCLADFGRFVRIGKEESARAGELDRRLLQRNISLVSFDLTDLFHTKQTRHRAKWDELVAQALQLHRSGQFPKPPIKVFSVTDISEACCYHNDKSRVAKVVVSLEDDQACISVAAATYASIFDAQKTYLLIGCLGGLGRSLSRWMMARGARRFVFLGRSGADKPSAQQLISRLKASGATVAVVRGDVIQAADVKAAVDACIATGQKLGGVVQAAMGLHEALFAHMTNQAWHTSIRPKWQGTWNLHNALEAHELDFFLLTSSVSGTIGTATESNYCAANGFLDAFARWRRSRGLPCVSIGLGMIAGAGYLHEHPEIEALLLRKGIQPLEEEEFLQVVDLAITSEAAGTLREAHMLTGLESSAIRKLGARGFDVTSHGVLVEPRASVLLASLQAEKEAIKAASSKHKELGVTVTPTPATWFKGIPKSLATTLASETDAKTMTEAIVRLTKKRFSNLILMPVDQLDETRSLPEFGVDSMIASEFRSWFWTVFRVDVPFLDMMSPQKSLLVLAKMIEGRLLGNALQGESVPSHG